MSREKPRNGSTHKCGASEMEPNSDIYNMKFAHGELILHFCKKKRNAYKHVLLHRGFESFHPIFGCVLNEVRNVAQSTKFGVQCN